MSTSILWSMESFLFALSALAATLLVVAVAVASWELYRQRGHGLPMTQPKPQRAAHIDIALDELRAADDSQARRRALDRVLDRLSQPQQDDTAAATWTPTEPMPLGDAPPRPVASRSSGSPAASSRH